VWQHLIGSAREALLPVQGGVQGGPFLPRQVSGIIQYHPMILVTTTVSIVSIVSIVSRTIRMMRMMRMIRMMRMMRMINMIITIIMNMIMTMMILPNNYKQQNTQQ